MANTRLTQKDIKTTIKTLKNKKSHGSDGIPGEAYEVLRKYINPATTKEMNRIKKGAQMSKEWAEGTIAHIYKGKGEIDECSSYRPICLAQVIYKIWSQLLKKNSPRSYT